MDYSAVLTLINPQNGREKAIPMIFDPECKIFSGENSLTVQSSAILSALLPK